MHRQISIVGPSSPLDGGPFRLEALRLVAGGGWVKVGDGGAPSALIRRFFVVAHQRMLGED